MTAIAQTAHVSGRHLRAFVRQPWFVGVAIIQPVIWLLLFGALFSGITKLPGFGSSAGYIDYLVPGVLVMTAIVTGVLVTEREAHLVRLEATVSQLEGEVRALKSKLGDELSVQPAPPAKSP